MKDNEYVEIAGGDPVKLARLREIGSWFDNNRQLAATVRTMLKYLKKSESEALHPGGVSRLHIEVLLWAMEQADSPKPVVRRRWWLYRSKIEHPEDVDAESIKGNFMVPFVKVPPIEEPVESSSTNCKKRRAFVATSLPRSSPRFTRRSPRLTAQRSAAEE